MENYHYHLFGHIKLKPKSDIFIAQLKYEKEERAKNVKNVIVVLIETFCFNTSIMNLYLVEF